MEEKRNRRNSKIRRIFENMDYDITPEKKNKPVPLPIHSNRSVIFMISESASKQAWSNTTPIQRCQKLNQFAEVIEENASTFTQPENIRLLAEYIVYYSTFSLKLAEKNSDFQPSGVAVCVVEHSTPLWCLGAFLGPALASGHNVVFTGSDNFVLSVAHTIGDLSETVGIPTGTIATISSSETNIHWGHLNNDNVATITIFGDLRSEFYNASNFNHKKIINLSFQKIPYIIFESSDLDSAIENLVESAWNPRSTIPFQVGSVHVQENIYETFLKKLKSTLSKHQILEVPEMTTQQILQKLKQTKNLGIEVFQPFENKLPAIIIGRNPDTNNVLNCDPSENYLPIILPFRTIDEGISLANNTRQGLAASIWTENISLANEASRKLKVSNVWVNSFGIISPNVPFSPLKDSGVGYFGGIEGFNEYLSENVAVPCYCLGLKVEPNLKIIDAISAAKSAQESWERVKSIDKMKIFQRIAEELNKDEFKEIVYECISLQNKPNYNCNFTGYTVMSTRVPKGVLVIECKEKTNFKLVVSALIEGNAIILLNKLSEVDSIYKTVAAALPRGILVNFSYTNENIQATTLHNELNTYLGDGPNNVYSNILLKDSKLFTLISHENNIVRDVTAVKNIWLTVGQSSQCNL